MVKRLAEGAERLSVAKEEIDDGKRAIKAISSQSTQLEEKIGKLELDLEFAGESITGLRKDNQALLDQINKMSLEQKASDRLISDQSARRSAPIQALAQIGKQLSNHLNEFFLFLNHLR